MKREWVEPTEEERDAFRAILEASGGPDAFAYARSIGLGADCDACGGAGWHTVSGWLGRAPEQESCDPCNGTGEDAPQTFFDIMFPPYVPDERGSKALRRLEEDPFFAEIGL